MSSPFIEVSNLEKHFAIPSPKRGGPAFAYAVNGISFRINRYETFGLVGESGCGKTVTGKMMLKLIEPSSGSILMNGADIVKIGTRRFRSMRKSIQTVFQDPNAALDPKMTISSILSEPLLLHKLVERPDEKKEVARLLEAVGLDESTGSAFPHELSSGQKQRIAIAKAIAVKPDFIVCDEPVSALDVSVQSQILNLLQSLKKDYGMTYLFISHNLGVVHHICDIVAVMYLGKIVETGPTLEIFSNPVHPYTKALLSASPVPDPSRRTPRTALPGEVPSCTCIPEGCAFHPRCHYASERCRTAVPETRSLTHDHTVACHMV